MSLTTPSLHVPHHRVPFPTWIRNHLSWMLVGLAVLAAVAVLSITLVDSDSGWQYHFRICHGDTLLAEGRAAVMLRSA